MARPRSEESRNRVVVVRVSEEEYSMLLDIQNEDRGILSEIVRKAIRFYYNFVRGRREFL